MERVVITEVTIEELLKLLGHEAVKTASAYFNQVEQPSANDLMNVKQAAEFLDLKPKAIYERVAKKEIPFYKDKHRLYFLKSELLEDLKRKTAEGLSETDPSELLVKPKKKPSSSSNT